MSELLIIAFVGITISFLIAEFFGRSKHIGRWWTFFLLLSGLIPGIIALIVSPSAKDKPTKGGKSYNIWAWICLVFGIGNTITLIGSEGQTGQLFFAFFILSYYLFELSKGEVINKEPKYYFDNLKINSSTYSARPNIHNSNSSGNLKSNYDDTKANLKKLKNSGLLTQFEYLNKLKIIEGEKGKNILKSDAYLKLKQLYDSGALDTAEFYSKLGVLEDSVSQVEPIKKKNTNQVYYSIAGIVILFVLFVSWDKIVGAYENSNSFRNEDNQEFYSVPIERNFESTKEIEPINVTKFVYALIKTNEPFFAHMAALRGYDDYGVYYKIGEDINSVGWKEMTHVTDIKEIQGYNDDVKYRFLDEVEPKVKLILYQADNRFFGEVYGKCTDASKKSSLVENHSKLIDKDILVFDSYAEASKHRQKNSSEVILKESTSITNNTFRVVSSKAFFHNEANNETRRNAFLVYGEVVKSAQMSNDFVYVTFINSSGSESKGWLKMADLTDD
jgi:hypothetical protein